VINVFLQFWEEIDSDSEEWKEDEDFFSPQIILEKRSRKPSYKIL